MLGLDSTSKVTSMKTTRNVGVQIPLQIFKLFELESEKTGRTKHSIFIDAIVNYAVTNITPTT